MMGLAYLANMTGWQHAARVSVVPYQFRLITQSYQVSSGTMNSLASCIPNW